MPLRNPFARRTGGAPVQDENARPEISEDSPPGFERVDTVGSKASSALSIGSGKSQDTEEYKLSVVNDSGVYLPPSPTEEKAETSWPRKYLSSRTSSDTRSSIGDIEHFSISRESFDSYRRSFVRITLRFVAFSHQPENPGVEIPSHSLCHTAGIGTSSTVKLIMASRPPLQDVSARSPVPSHEAPGRQSLDSARFPRFQRSSIRDRPLAGEPPTEEEGFEDVGLDDQKVQPRRRGFFSKFSETPDKESGNSSPVVSRFHLPGRKRGHSQGEKGAELGNLDGAKPIAVVEAREGR